MNNNLDDVVMPTGPCPPSKHSTEEWEEELASLEHVRGQWNDMAVLAGEAKGDYLMAVESGERFADREPVLRLVRHGASFERAAAILGTNVHEIAAHFTRDGEDVAKVVKCERLLRAGHDVVFKDVSAATGLSVDQAKRLAGEMGVVSVAARSRRHGGGDVYGPDVYEKIRVLKEQGKSGAEIGRRLNMERTTVNRIAARRGFGVSV